MKLEPATEKQASLFESTSALRSSAHYLCERIEGLHRTLCGDVVMELSKSAETVSRGTILDNVFENNSVDRRIGNAQEMLREIARKLGVEE